MMAPSNLTPLASLRLTALRENLRLVTGFIQSTAYRLHLDDKTSFEVELAVEEAATNIISHAYRDQDNGLMQVEVALLGQDVLVVTLTDWGIPFPLKTIPPFDYNAPIETRIQGGMGLHLIHQLMESVERQASDHLGNPNTLTLTKHIQTTTRLPQLRQRQELNALQSVSGALTSNIALDDLLRLIVNKLVETIQAERGTLFLVDAERGECWSKIMLETNDALPEIRLKLGEGIAGHVAQTGEALNIPNAHQHPLFQPGFDHMTGYYTRTILAVPMWNSRQQVIGVVELLNKVDGVFTSSDERLLTAMASQAAISIENARLYQRELAQKLLERELQTAAEIQASFLPQDLPSLPGWQMSAYWKPVQGVAGDFYDFRLMDDGRLAVIVADVSGKGIPAALFMAMTVITLRFGMSLNLSPYDLIIRTNNGIIQHQHSRMFATIFIAYLDPQTGLVDYISAGHNPPMLYRHATGQVETLRGEGVAVGVFKEARFVPQTAQLAPQDVLIFYTDGITEIINAQQEEFGEDRLEALVRQHHNLPAQALSQAIVQAVHGFAGEARSFDDETLLVVKWAG
jgi:serine phosphatase RsbU (regulator of sigma subunit)/anti-sigma regulatory factor (Ser/Thr protein kinase)